MTPDDFKGLDICRYRIRLRACEDAVLPAFSGPMLRGAFGRALSRTLCLGDRRRCSTAGCQTPSRCLYSYLFATPAPPGSKLLQKDAPVPFVVAAAFPALAAASRRPVLPAGSDMEFTLTLIGRATAHYREVRRAVDDMARSSLGEDGSYFQFDLAEVTLIDEPEGKSTGVSLGEVVSARVGGLNGLRSIGLRSITPLRIELKTQGGAKRLQERPTLEMIATEIAWRFRLLAEVHGQPVGDMKSAAKALVSAMNTTDETWRWDDNTKHNSARHGDRLTFGGAMGEVRIEGDTLGLLLPLLAAGEILHVGKVTSSGLGRYELVRPSTPGTGEPPCGTVRDH